MFFLNAFRVAGMRVAGWKGFLEPMGSKQRAVFLYLHGVGHNALGWRIYLTGIYVAV